MNDLFDAEWLAVARRHSSLLMPLAEGLSAPSGSIYWSGWFSGMDSDRVAEIVRRERVEPDEFSVDVGLTMVRDYTTLADACRRLIIAQGGDPDSMCADTDELRRNIKGYFSMLMRAHDFVKKASIRWKECDGNALAREADRSRLSDTELEMLAMSPVAVMYCRALRQGHRVGVGKVRLQAPGECPV